MASVSEWLATMMGSPVGQLTPNQYVQNNFPSRRETFYTPFGMEIPPGGRVPTAHEQIEGAPHRLEIAAAIRRLRDGR